MQRLHAARGAQRRAAWQRIVGERFGTIWFVDERVGFRASRQRAELAFIRSDRKRVGGVGFCASREFIIITILITVIVMATIAT